MNRIKIFSVFLLLILTCCSEDEPVKKPVSVTSVVATGNDINTNLQLTRLFSETTVTTNVAINSAFVVSFSKEVTEETATSANIVVTKSGVAVPVGILVDGETVIITPEDQLVLETTYILSLSSGIKAADGSKFVAVTRSFTTQQAPLYLNDVTANGSDIVTQNELTRLFSETDATTNVPINSDFVISFSENVASETVTSENIKITKSGVIVPADISVAGSQIFITPDAQLELETNYVLSLSGALKGVDGNIFTATTRNFTTQDNPLEDGLVAHYTFENGLAQDKSGLGNNGVITGAQPGKDRSNRDNESLIFDSETDRVYVASPAFLNNSTGTFAAWVKFDNLDNTQYLTSVGDESNTTNYMAFVRIDGADHSIGYYWRNNSEAVWLKSSAVVTTGVYYHMVVVANGEKVRIYLNNVEISQISGLDNFVIGNVALQTPHPLPNVAGNLDEVRLYNRVLSQNEITLLYTSTK
jgi:Concanavalin A-like lectin/glucanases superfamily/Bacterial Ig-like domain